MIDKIKNLYMKIFYRFKSRLNFWLALLVLPAFFFVPLWWFLASFIVYRLLDSIKMIVFHEYQTHKILKPKNVIIEIIGYYLICSADASPPFNKVKYHWTHHKFYNDVEKDPTLARCGLVKSLIEYCLDLGPAASHHSIDDSEISIIPTPTYMFFQKYWLYVFTANIIIWVTLTSWWVFVSWFVFPVWIYGMLGRSVDYIAHGKGIKDKNYMVLLYGVHAFHNYHHENYLLETKPYYGNKFWQYLNTDFYIHKLFCKPF
jgi:hypothetical protein